MLWKHIKLVDIYWVLLMGQASSKGFTHSSIGGKHYHYSLLHPLLKIDGETEAHNG